jgi:hypothetical protein
MTPTLLGRWQTRLVMLATFGLVITLVFALSYRPFNETFFVVLFWVAVFGLGWDIVFILLQKLRWDRDWPPLFQWLAAAAEGLAVYLVIDNTGLPGVAEGGVPAGIFTAHYGLVFFTTWAWTQGPMRALFPRWRFDGGRVA